MEMMGRQRGGIQLKELRDISLSFRDFQHMSLFNVGLWS